MRRFLFSFLAAVAIVRTRVRGAGTTPTPSVSPSPAAFGARSPAKGGSLVVAPAPLGVGVFDATAAVLSGARQALLVFALASSVAPPALAQGFPAFIAPSALSSTATSLGATRLHLLSSSDPTHATVQYKGRHIVGFVLSRGDAHALYVFELLPYRFTRTNADLSGFAPASIHVYLPTIRAYVQAMQPKVQVEPTPVPDAFLQPAPDPPFVDDEITPDDVEPAPEEQPVVLRQQGVPFQSVVPPVPPPPSIPPTTTLEVSLEDISYIAVIVLVLFVIFGTASIFASARAAINTANRRAARSINNLSRSARRNYHG